MVAKAVQLAIELNPDVILMDISMPIMNGIKATEEICAQRPNIRVIGLTIHEDPDIRQTMLDAGARTCLLKNRFPG